MSRLNLSHLFYFLIELEMGFKILLPRNIEPLLFSNFYLNAGLNFAKYWTLFWLYYYWREVFQYYLSNILNPYYIAFSISTEKEFQNSMVAKYLSPFYSKSV